MPETGTIKKNALIEQSDVSSRAVGIWAVDRIVAANEGTLPPNEVACVGFQAEELVQNTFSIFG